MGAEARPVPHNPQLPQEATPAVGGPLWVSLIQGRDGLLYGPVIHEEGWSPSCLDPQTPKKTGVDFLRHSCSS